VHTPSSAFPFGETFTVLGLAGTENAQIYVHITGFSVFPLLQIPLNAATALCRLWLRMTAANEVGEHLPRGLVYIPEFAAHVLISIVDQRSHETPNP
jgi:hypothetical protein